MHFFLYNKQQNHDFRENRKEFSLYFEIWIFGIISQTFMRDLEILLKVSMKNMISKELSFEARAFNLDKTQRIKRIKFYFRYFKYFAKIITQDII